MSGTHPFLAPYGAGIEAGRRVQIQQAIQTLGFDHVNARAWEFTRYRTLDSWSALGEFAAEIETEAAYERTRQMMIAQQRLLAIRAEQERIRRRNAAAEALLLEP